MSTTGLKWDNVSAPGLSEGVGNLMRDGGDRVSAGIRGIADVLKDVQKERGRVATDNAMKNIQGLNDPDAIAKASAEIMNNAAPGADTSALMGALDSRRKMLMDEQGQKLQQQKLRNENGVFQQNQNLSVQEAEARIRGAQLGNIGKVIDNKTGQVKLDFLPAKAKTEQSQAEANLFTTQTENKVLPDMLKAEYDKKKADARTAGTDADYREQRILSELESDRVSRTVAQGNLGVNQQRLKLDQRKHNAAVTAARSKVQKANKDAGLSRDMQLKQAEALKVFAADPSPDNAASYLNLGGKSSDVNSVRAAVAKDKFTGSGGYSMPASYQKVAGSAEEDTGNNMYIYADDLANRNGEIKLPENIGGTAYLTPQGYKHYLLSLAKESSGDGLRNWVDTYNDPSKAAELETKWFAGLSDKQKLQFVKANDPVKE